MNDEPLRPGGDQLRQAILVLPIGVVCLVLGAVLADDADAVGSVLLLVGVVASLLGVFRLLQGLYYRVG